MTKNITLKIVKSRNQKFNIFPTCRASISSADYFPMNTHVQLSREDKYSLLARNYTDKFRLGIKIREQHSLIYYIIVNIPTDFNKRITNKIGAIY